MKNHLKDLINSELKLQKSLAAQLGVIARDPENNKEKIIEFRKDNIASKERVLRYEKMLENE